MIEAVAPTATAVAVRNQKRDEYRRDQARKRAEQEYARQRPEAVAPQPMVDAAAEVLAVSPLLRLKFVDNLTYEEIAGKLGVSVSEAHRRVDAEREAAARHLA